jgi:hypothetical protein
METISTVQVRGSFPDENMAAMICGEVVFKRAG